MSACEPPGKDVIVGSYKSGGIAMIDPTSAVQVTRRRLLAAAALSMVAPLPAMNKASAVENRPVYGRGYSGGY